MPRKAKKSGSRRMRGGSFFGDVGNFFTRTIPSAAKTVYNKALKPAGNFIKDRKIISTVAKLAAPFDPTGRVGMVGNLAGQVGLGRKRRTRRGMRGGSVVRF